MEKHADKLRIVFGDVTLGVHGADFSYIFSYASGGLESLVLKGREWLYRSPKPTFWRALTDNDRGNGFALRSGMWLSADMFQKSQVKAVWTDGEKIPLPIAPENNKYGGEQSARKLAIAFETVTAAFLAAKVTVLYEVYADGRLKVSVHYFGQKGLPELPLFGMRFILPTKADGYRYRGLSGETYPDRMAGGIPGVYEINGLQVTPYLVPQDCQVHMDSEWLEIYRSTTLIHADKRQEHFGIRFAFSDKRLAFSCLPYTAEELENATHIEELPPARRTVVSILGAVRGVGGINSWGADVEPAYRVSAENDMEFSFMIQGI